VPICSDISALKSIPNTWNVAIRRSNFRSYANTAADFARRRREWNKRRLNPRKPNEFPSRSPSNLSLQNAIDTKRSEFIDTGNSNGQTTRLEKWNISRVFSSWHSLISSRRNPDFPSALLCRKITRNTRFFFEIHCNVSGLQARHYRDNIDNYR
jgi:hypothetical protein